MNLHWPVISTEVRVVSIRVPSWWCTFCRLGQVCDDMHPPLLDLTKWFHCLQIPHHRFPPSPPSFSHWSFHCLHSSCHGWAHTVCKAAGWLLLLSSMCLSFLFASSHDMAAHFFLVLNNITLSGCTTVLLSHSFLVWRTSRVASSFVNYE